ncbi:GNAT family N-acetyltransferase [Brachybacterium sp. YJGR34]|uniref:GNAT family N-acetyltransferase n=1 Tax=Brachybacterium sp. YJGR34 TaxID=2059911 RepID=UPI0018E5D245|nr:GNAT family N-acetyltransferase [Brachybacterium sp. YJGR34]
MEDEDAVDARDGVLLATERLWLRPWRPKEAVVLRALWAERDPRVPPHRRIDEDGRPSLEDLEASIRRQAHRPGGLGLPALEIRATGEVIGYCGLVEDGPGAAALGDEHPGPELAVELLRRAQGAGYATEAGRAVMAWARGAGIPRLQATVWDWNYASRRLLTRLGFVETDRSRPAGAEHEMLVMTAVLGESLTAPSAGP